MEFTKCSCLYWVDFGSNGFKKVHKGLVHEGNVRRMEFKDIFNPLKACLSDGQNRQYFFRELMAMITTVTEEEWGTKMDPNTKRTNDNTILNYIKRGLSQAFAQSIVNRLTPEILEEHIKEKPVTTRKALARELSIYDEKVNSKNVAKRAPEMLVEIIIISAGLSTEGEIEIKREKTKRTANIKTKSLNVDNDAKQEKTLCEDDRIRVKEFMIRHEKEKELIPLCQIASIHSPEHRHVRSMYTEYILLPKRIQDSILIACEAEEMIGLTSLNIGKAIDFLCEDLKKYELSSERFLRMFDQYLVRAFYYYSDCDIDRFDIYSFPILYKCTIKPFESIRYSSISQYINDYLWMKDNEIDSDAIPPMDFLWHYKNFGKCKEEDLTFWLCRFVIDVCHNLYLRVRTSHIDYIIIDDQYAETQEDLYYCALYYLHILYLCHTLKSSDASSS